MSRFLNTKLHFSGKLAATLTLSILALCLAFVFAKTPKAEAACAPTTSYGTDTLSVNVPSSTSYTVWVRMLSPDGKNNQVDLSIDGGNCSTMNGGTMTANTWAWVDATTASSSPLVVSLTAGTHSLVLTGNQTGVGVDRVLLLSDNTCTPTGTGSNCTPLPTSSIPLYINAGGPAFTDPTGIQWMADQDYTIDNAEGSSGGVSAGGDGSSCTTSTQNSNCTTHTITVPAGNNQTVYQTERWGGFHYDIPVHNGKYNVVLKFAEINPSSGSRSQNVSIEGTQVLTSFSAATAVGSYAADDQTFPVTVSNGDLNITLTTVTNAASLSGIEVLPFTTSPPTVSLTAPANGATVSGNVALTASATDTSGVSSVQFSIDGTALATVNGSPYTTTWNSTTVANGSHTIKAVATNTAGQTASSSVTVTVNNVNKTPPTTPTNVTAKATAYNSVTLGWGASTDPTGVSSYTILRGLAAAAPQAIATVNGTALTYIDSTVSGSTSYTYQIVANDAAGLKSPASTAVSVTTPPAPTQNPPSVTVTAPLNGTTVSGSVNIASTATDQVGVTKVEFLIDGVVVNTLTAPNSKTVVNGYTYTWNTAGVSQGDHTITVTGFNAAGLTDSVDVVVNVNNGDTTPPSTPGSVTATAPAYNSVSLQWNPSTDNVGVTGYYVLRANGKAATSGYTTLATLTTPAGGKAPNASYVDNTVQASSWYSYEIEAFDAAGNVSKPSTVASVQTPTGPVTTPTPPSSLAGIAASTTQINLTWNASTTPVTGYQVFENGTLVATDISTTSFGVSGLKPNTSYSFYVVAYSTGGFSGPSNTVTVTTLAQSTTGVLAGTISNKQGNPLAARVKYDCIQGECTFAYANQYGVYIITNIPAGYQRVSYGVPKSAYIPQHKHLTINAGQVLIENVVLKK